jgi:hypothetical protein
MRAVPNPTPILKPPDVRGFLMIDGEQPDTTVRRRFLPTRKQMNDPKQQAEQLFKEQKPTTTMSEYEREQEKIRANLERLRRERLAREAGSERSGR